MKVNMTKPGMKIRRNSASKEFNHITQDLLCVSRDILVFYHRNQSLNIMSL